MLGYQERKYEGNVSYVSQVHELLTSQCQENGKEILKTHNRT